MSSGNKQYKPRVSNWVSMVDKFSDVLFHTTKGIILQALWWVSMVVMYNIKSMLSFYGKHESS